MSKLDEMVQAEADYIWTHYENQGLNGSCPRAASLRMAEMLRGDTAFRALCEERLERLEAEREELATDIACDAQEGATVNTDCLHRADRQISALRTLLEG